ncbi:MAG: alpha-2-macroglobulin family protein, partial [Sulfurimicrobium sp.]|nr:alpha-2-macroglobulin family protein [Sulfurimicrobium sp.]
MEITDPETSQTLKYRFYAGWSARADETQGIRPDRVALKLDKPAYKEGETVRLTLISPYAGEVLVTVEADKTLWVKRISVPLDGTTLDIPLDKAWKRHDLYVSAVVLRPGSEGEKVTPARALGLLHLPLERSDRKLTATLEAPRKMLPSSPLKVRLKVPEAKGQQAVVTLSAVDVGILNITRFATPDPFEHFFGKLRYGADMYDVYGRLIEKLGGQKGKLKFGGDSAPKATRSLPKKVRLVDLFSGPVALNAQGEAEIALDVPDFIGTLRLMAVVATPDRFANAESEVVVAAPLVAELLTPRFLTIGDQAVIALDLQNLSGAAQKLKVALISRDGLKIHNAERELALKDQQKQTLRFNVESGSAFGLGEVRL